jgi:glucokinase
MLVGVDVAGATVQAGIVEKGTVVSALSMELRADSTPEEVLDSIAELVRKLSPTPELVGVAIPGEVNTDGRCWRLPNLPGFEGLALAQQVAGRLKCPVAVENRATTAALAEQLFGHGREHPSFLMVTLGTGVGGGLVLGHQLYPGANGFGAELGHIKVDYAADAPLCGCGQRGCLEAYVGSRALLREHKARTGLELDITALRQGVLSRQAPALRLLDAAGRALGRALANVQSLLDLNAIVLACGSGLPFEPLASATRRELRQQCFAPPLVNVPLLESKLGDQAAVVGAAYLAQL